MITSEQALLAVNFLDSLISAKTSATFGEFQQCGAAIRALQAFIGDHSPEPLPPETDAPVDLPQAGE